MTSEPAMVPTACTLTTTQARDRVDRWQALAQHAQLGTPELHDGVLEIRYARTAQTLAEMRALVELEAHCCAFLTFDLHETGDVALLRVGPAPGADPSVAAELRTLTSSSSGPNRGCPQ